jgi:hypothetical protein
VLAFHQAVVAKKDMNSAAQAIAGLSGTATASPILYYAGYLLPRTMNEVPRDLSDGVEGLVLSHLVRLEDGSKRVFTYWQSAQHFDGGDEVLRDRLQAPSPEHGPINAVATPAKPWWRKVKPLTVVLSIAAAIGAIDAIVIRYDWLLAKPLLLVKPEKTKTEILESANIRIAVSVVNQLPRTEHRNVKVAVELIDTARKRHPLRLVEQEIAVLPGGATKDLMVEGTAPPAGLYRFQVAATADAGLWRSSKTFSGEAQFNIWSRTPRGSVRLVESKSSWARFVGTIEVGHAAPLGVDCEIQSQGAPRLAFDRQFRTTIGYRNLQWRTAGERDSSISILTWSMTAVESMQSITAEVIFLGEPATDWAAVAERIKLNCAARQEKLNESKV